MAIMHFEPKTARGSVDCGMCLRARFRDMGEVCTLVLLIVIVRRFDQISFHTLKSSLEGATELNLRHSAPHFVPFLTICLSTFSDSGQKPWTIVKRFDQISLRNHNSSLEGAAKLKLRHSAPLEMPFQMICCLAEIDFQI